jgi:predicted metalloprotease with PDZ domain
LTFRGDGTGHTRLKLPSTWAGETDLSHAIVNLHALSATTALNGSEDPDTFVLQYPPSRNIAIAYDLAQDWSGQLRHPKEFHVVLRLADFVFNGNNGLVHPELNAPAPVGAILDWKGLPPGWTVVTSFGAGGVRQKFHGSWRELQGAFFAAGDFRLRHSSVAGEKLTIAIQGSWIFTDTQAEDELRKIFAIERNFWSDHHRDSYLVIILPFDQDLGSSDGTVLTKTIQFYLSRKQTFGTEEKALLAHEVFHTWNPYRIGLPPNRSGEVSWFTEGFTTYYQERILLWAGLVTYAEYLERLNAIVSEYWNSADRNWTQEQWLARKNTTGPEGKLPYNRGAVVAFWLDQALQQQNPGHRSLDDVMFGLARGKGRSRITTESLLRDLGSDLSPADNNALRSFVLDGTTIPLPPSLFGNCARIDFMGRDAVPQYLPVQSAACMQVRAPSRK